MNEKAGSKPETTPVISTTEIKAEEVKTAEAKPAVSVQASVVKPVDTKVTEEKPATVEASVKKEPVKASTTKKEAPKKKAGRKPAAKKQENSTEVFVEFYGQQSSVEEIKKRVTDLFVGEGHRASTIKSLKLYLKPEDSSAYYVINDKFAGRVDLF